MASVYHLKAKMFHRDGVEYLDYLDVVYEQTESKRRLRPVVRSLEEGFFVEMMEMNCE